MAVSSIATVDQLVNFAILRRLNGEVPPAQTQANASQNTQQTTPTPPAQQTAASQFASQTLNALVANQGNAATPTVADLLTQLATATATTGTTTTTTTSLASILAAALTLSPLALASLNAAPLGLTLTANTSLLGQLH